MNTKDEESAGHLLKEVLKKELNVSIQRLGRSSCHKFLWHETIFLDKAHKSFKCNAASSSFPKILHRLNNVIGACSILSILPGQWFLNFLML